MRKHVKKTAAIISLLFAAILLLGGCSGTSTAVLSSSKNSGISSSDVSSAISSSETSSAAPEVLPTVQDLELDSSLAQNPEELVKTLFDGRFTSWYNAGATPENAKKAFENAQVTGDYEEFAKKIASETDNLYIQALYIPDAENTPELKSVIDNGIEIHWQTLEFYFRTSMPKGVVPGDIVPYMTGEKLSKVDTFNTLSDHYVLSVYEHRFSNEDQNTVGERVASGFKVDTTDVNTIITFINIGGKLKISSMS